MTDLIEERLRVAADQAMAGVELAPPDDADDTSADAAPGNATQRRRWWITASAGLVAAAVLAVVVWAAALREPAPTEPVRPSPDASPQVRARAAVEATLAAPQWRAEISGGVTPFALWFHEPDRYESMSGVEPTNQDEDDPARAVQIGRDLYITDDGGWTRTTMPERDLGSSHRSLLSGLLADGPCFADVGELIVAWQDPETGCGSSTTALPGDLPAGSDLWVVRIDRDGRVAELAVGEIPGAVGSERQDINGSSPVDRPEIEAPIWQAGGQFAITYAFTYDDIPPIAAPAESVPSDLAAIQECQWAVSQPPYAAASARVVAAYDTTVADAYAWRNELANQSAEAVGISDPGTDFAAAWPVDDLARTDPGAAVSFCYVDGEFADPGPPGGLDHDRSALMVTPDRRIVGLLGGSSTDTSAGPAMAPARP